MIPEPTPPVVFQPEAEGVSQGYRLMGASMSPDGRAAPKLIKRGPKGDPSRTFAGDLGPLQGSFSRVRTVAAPNSYRGGRSTALPSTTGPSNIQDQLGTLGI